MKFTTFDALALFQGGRLRLAARLGQVAKDVREWNMRRRTLHEARSLDDRMLEDVGLTRADLRRTGFWDR